MLLPGIIATARTMMHYQQRLQFAANNVANAATDGFKADLVAAALAADGKHPVSLQLMDLSQGSLQPTGRTFDVALDGPGFFVLDTPGGEQLSRGGSLHLDPSGRLVDASGTPLLGVDGPITIVGDAVEIRDDGAVVVDDALAGQLRVVNVQNPQELLKVGAGRFLSRESLESVDPAETVVRQGMLEQSNSEALSGLVDMIGISRAYGSNVQVLRAMDSVLETVSTRVGRV